MLCVLCFQAHTVNILLRNTAVINNLEFKNKYFCIKNTVIIQNLLLYKS